MGKDEWKRESLKELNVNKRNLGSIVKTAAMAGMAALFLAGTGLSIYSLNRTEKYPAGSYVPGEVIVNVRDLSAMAWIDTSSMDSGEYYLSTKIGMFEAEQMFPNIRDEEMSEYFVVKVPAESDMRYLMTVFGRESEVEEAFPNFYMEILPDYASKCAHDNRSEATIDTLINPNAVPNDPYYHSKGSWGQDYEDMYGLKKPNAEGAWEITKGDDRVIIAVVDTGANATHPDLQGRLWRNLDEIAGDGIDNDRNGFVDDVFGYNFVDNNENTNDGHGHGTHVSGTIAATTNNEIGVAGINWYGKIMPVKVLSDDGRGSLDGVARGIVYAADNGAWVINMSLGGPAGFGQSVIDRAIQYADSKGTIVVVAAGNSDTDAMKFSPANNPLVITVAAVDRKDDRAFFSNYGKKIDIGAPGVCIISTVPEKNKIPTDRYPILEKFYGVLSGTSMASPHAAGEVALILGANPELHGQREAVRKIVRAAVDPVQTQPDKPIGTGRMNLEQAVKLAKEWR